MASYSLPSNVMAIKFNKCDHTEAKSLMICVRNAKLIEEIFNDHHIITDHESYEKYYMVKSFCKTELNSSEKFEVKNILTVGEVVDSNMKGFPRIDFKTSTEYFTNYLPKLEV